MTPSKVRRVGLAWLAGIALAAGTAAMRPAIAGLVLGVAVGVVAWRWPAATLGVVAFAVLAVRPSLDLFSERRLGLGPFTSNPAVVFGLTVLLTSAVLASRRARDGRPIWPDRQLLYAHWWLLVAYGIGFVSASRLYGGAGSAVATREFLRVASVVGAFLIVLWWIEERQERYQLGWSYLILGTITPVTLSLWQFVTGRGNLDVEGVNRLQGTFSHPNTFGPFLVPFILLAVGGLRSSRGGARVLRFAVAAALSVLLALTYSRTAVIVLLAGFVALPLLQAHRFGWRALVGSGVVVVIFSGLGWLLAGNLIRERFTGIRITADALQAAQGGETENSLEWRLMLWGVLATAGREHSVTGHGLGMTTELNPIVNRETGIPYNAHNDFIRLYFETGLSGLLAYLIYGLLLCRWALLAARAADRTRAPSAYAVAAALLALFFLTLGVPEFGSQTAIQYETYGMLALMTAITSLRSDPISRRSLLAGQAD